MNKIDTDVLIIGAGPVGLFTVFQLGQLGIKSCIIDCLSEVGGQCSALYPEKPIYDIPAYPDIKAIDLVKKLQKQISPFRPEIFLNQRVDKIKEDKNKFFVSTSTDRNISARCIIIAAGNGAFGPNKPPLDGIDEYENKTLFYNIRNKKLFDNKTVAIAGGGDSAADWAIELSKNAKKIYFIHRRTKLRAAPNSVKKLYDLEKKKKIEMIIPFQLDSLVGDNGKIEKINVRNIDGKIKELDADFFLPFFGLSSELGPIKDWELEIEKNILKVDQSTCMTSREGIFAIGDICSYPGKLKLILTGFSEAAIASHSCYNRVYPEKVLHFEYSTTKGIKKLI